MVGFGKRSGVGVDQCRDFLAGELQVEFKATPYINRTQHGLEFLGCRVHSSHLHAEPQKPRPGTPWRLALERLYGEGRIDETELQRRATALFAYMRAGGCASWRFRCGLLQQLSVGGQ